jgi:hypothetical protein
LANWLNHVYVFLASLDHATFLMVLIVAKMKLQAVVCLVFAEAFAVASPTRAPKTSQAPEGTVRSNDVASRLVLLVLLV